jgi:tartrate-resistant acid phosphatase type 5
MRRALGGLGVLVVTTAACGPDAANGDSPPALTDAVTAPDVASDTAPSGLPAPDSSAPPAPDAEAPTPDAEAPAPDVEGPASDAAVSPDIAQPPPPPEVRFVVLGDAGTGSETQRKVAVAVRDHCAREGCDFALMPGDNIYDAGVTDVLDAQWETKFEAPYRDVPMPFYAALGNHDNGGFLTQWLGGTFAGAGAEFERGDVQVAYSAVSEKWRMPGRTYDFRQEHAHFFALDTNDMLWSVQSPLAETRSAAAVATTPGRIDASDATWKIAFGHHPWVSNGTHGDAGAYEGLEEDITDLVAAVPFLGDLSDVVTGDGVRSGLEAIVCGRVDLYFAGHDHSLQWFEAQAECPGTHFVVSGAGAKLTRLKRDDRTRFQHVATAGFFHVTLRGRTLLVTAIDEDGAVLWRWQAEKP